MIEERGKVGGFTNGGIRKGAQLQLTSISRGLGSYDKEQPRLGSVSKWEREINCYF